WRHAQTPRFDQATAIGLEHQPGIATAFRRDHQICGAVDVFVRASLDATGVRLLDFGDLVAGDKPTGRDIAVAVDVVTHETAINDHEGDAVALCRSRLR